MMNESLTSGIHWGVVEDRDSDPLMLGRCKVRVLGVHSEDKVALPTKDLPWAYPLMPFGNASMNGIGNAPIGVVEGTWCAVVFRDPDKQHPVLMGTIGGVPEKKTGKQGKSRWTDPLSTSSSNDSLIKIWNFDTAAGITAGMSSGNIARFTYDNTKTVILGTDRNGAVTRDFNGPMVLGWFNGGLPVEIFQNDIQISEYRRALASLPNPPALGTTIELGRGWAAGTGWVGLNGQPVTSNTVKAGDGSTVVDGSGNPVQTGTTAETPPPSGNLLKPGALKMSDTGIAFLRNEEALSSLVQGQNKYTKKVVDDSTPLYPYQDTKGVWTIGYGSTYLADGSKVNSNTRMNAGQAVELFKIHLAKEVEAPLNKKLTAPVTQEMFDAMCSMSYNMGAYGFMKSNVFNAINTGNYTVAESLIPSLATGGGNGPRRIREADLFKAGGLPDTGVAPITTPVSTTDPATSVSSSANGNTQSNTDQTDDNIGFKDPNGVYPLDDWAYEPDTHRLARNESIDKTVVWSKEAARAIDVHCAGIAWNQPHVPYNAEYPFNQTRVTESGHIDEWDDSPANERLHRYHRKGTYEEIDREGTVIRRIVGDNYEIYERNGKILIKGESDVTIRGICRLQVDGDCYTKIFGNHNTQIEGNQSVYVKGNVEVKAEGSINFEAGGGITGLAGGAVAFDGSTLQWNSGGAGPANIVEILDTDIADTPPPHFHTLMEADRIFAIKSMFDAPEQESVKNVFLDQQIKAGNISADEVAAKTETVETTAPVETPIVAPVPDTCALLKEPFNNATVLSKHFTLGKFAEHSTAANGIPKAPQLGLSVAEIVCNMKYLADNVAEPIYARYPNMFIGSSFRSIAGNSIPGASTTSDHLTGSAIDVNFAGFNFQQKYEAAIEIQKFLPAYHQIILEYSGNSCWVHISLRRNGNNSHQIMTMDVGKNGKKYPGQFVLLG